MYDFIIFIVVILIYVFALVIGQLWTFMELLGLEHMIGQSLRYVTS